MNDEKRIRDTLSEKFESDRKIERETSAIINFYKLILIEKLTFIRSESEVKALGGDNIILKLKEDIEEGLISFSDTNEELEFRFNLNIEYMKTNPFSVNPLMREEMENLDWIYSIMNECPKEYSVCETMTNYANLRMFCGVFRPSFSEEFGPVQYAKRFGRATR